MDSPSKEFGISKLIYYFFLKKSFEFLFRFDENIEDGSIKQTYLCKSCDLEFTRRPEYQTHYFMKHYTPGSWTNGPMGKEFVFTCDHCTFSGRLGQMYKHYQKEHPGDDYVLSCTECDFQVVVGKKIYVVLMCLIKIELIPCQKLAGFLRTIIT